MLRMLAVLALLVLLLGMAVPAQVVFADDTEVFLPVITAGSGEQQQDRAAETGNAARSEGYPWNDHAAPYTYLFDNRMDQHQQSKKVGQNQLNGFLYIAFTGKIHEDPEQGSIPVAKHVDCANPPEREDGELMSCTVGWIMHGIHVQAKLLTYGSGPPTWCIDPSDMPNQPGYTHFHWERAAAGSCSGLGKDCPAYDGYLIKLTARETFRFVHAGHGETGGGHDGGSGGGHGGGGHDDGDCGGDHEEGGCGDDHDGGHPPGDPGNMPGGDHEEGGCSGDDHEEGGCSGDDHEEGDCGGDDGHDPGGGSDHGGGQGRGCGVNITPGVDEISHANFVLGTLDQDSAGNPICVETD
jgi:hypothetical protein